VQFVSEGAGGVGGAGGDGPEHKQTLPLAHFGVSEQAVSLAQSAYWNAGLKPRQDDEQSLSQREFGCPISSHEGVLVLEIGYP